MFWRHCYCVLGVFCVFCFGGGGKTRAAMKEQNGLENICLIVMRNFPIGLQGYFNSDFLYNFLEDVPGSHPVARSWVLQNMVRSNGPIFPGIIFCFCALVKNLRQGNQQYPVNLF